ncbi:MULTISPECIES: DUF882 domain-containing protein [Mesorhizobium]|uniref:Murein endopeptidase K n=1 Tax=Rhizobium loti TaxID=381 RepID=A0A6M7TY50_RHILI|nr:MULTISPECIES: DUF882 domain-containing protein [Mesorhizobium]KRB31125.1 peptidase M15 [Mesorhizobium sp. Root172]OBQ60880.1 peptidase M15 [Mesorhizobium loti]QKC69954.1 DUF882 domain-containing protein [Mesorhizobium loti]QKC92159.1 DUF882 domain-containing protein [Mesorhizobium sp. NZP2234]
MNVIESEQSAPGASHRWTWLPAIVVAFLCLCVTSASAETRALRIQHLHTGEKAEIVFKRNGRYDQAGLKKINFMLRDWRRNEPTRMDPRLLDLVWQAYRASGSTSYIHVVSAYRSPATNAMLRSRSKGVARESQHMVGRAMDFFLPDVPLKKLRDIGLKMQGGGVGYYPTSGSPFIHMDVGNVRHWPGISRQELARVFPNGNTLHVPSDGRPLPGYDQALAAYKSRKSAGTPNIELASADGGQRRPARGLLATLLGGRGADEAEDVAEAVPAPRKPARSVEPKTAGQGIAIVPPQDARRADIQVASAGTAEEPLAEQNSKTPEAIVMAMAPDSVPLPAFAPRATATASIPTPQPAPFAVASASSARAELAGVKPAAANAELPLGKTDAAPAAVAPVMVALNIPVPTWRPQSRTSPAPQPEAAKSADAVAALLAMHHPDDGHGLPVRQVAVPASKPEDRVRTSPKADRVQPRLDPEATAMIVPAASTGRPLAGRLGMAAGPTAAPVIAANFIRTAPEQVYLDGFQPRGQTSDHRRFTGSAVKFLPIASFK